ncbi:PQQ-binding-like beta-propeller repeat protein, partial [Thermogutta sp.]|uniref:PQQ-binding-like beta-propeller repeat protein n=1 Tax=Thermogutta sp. TaxID=1962930 RepID=UPI00321FA3D7
VYFGCMDGKVYCLNASTGALIWSYQTKKRDNATAAKLIQSPTVYNGVVYIGNESARVYALNASDGSPAWASPYDVPSGDLETGKEDITGVSSVAVANIGGQDRLYFGCDNGYLYCLNPSTKAQVWSYRPDSYGCIESSPTIYAGNVYFGITFYQGVNLYAVNATSGELHWATRLVPAAGGDLGEEVRATCAAMDNAVYVGEDTGHLFYRVNAQTGSLSQP